MPNGDPVQYFCGHGATKEGPHPVGWVGKDSSACGLLQQIERRERSEDKFGQKAQM